MKTIQEIETRLAEIKMELENPDADLDKLQEEVRSLNEMKAQLAEQAKADAEKRRKIAEGMGTTKEVHKEETENRTLDDIRKSRAYIDAYAEYVKTGDPKECRTLLTVNAPETARSRCLCSCRK